MKYFAPLVALLVGTAMPALAAAPAMHIVADPVHAAGLRDLGRANSGLDVSLVVSMRYRNEAQLDQFVDAVSNPASPIFRHFLTNQQFNAYFAPSVRDYNRVAAALVRAGFRVRPSSNGTIIDADGPAAAVERYFKTEIHVVQQAGVRGVRYANATPASMPNEIADAVDTVVGFDSLQRATPDHTTPIMNAVLPDALSGKIHGKAGGYSPFAIAQAYNYPVQHGFDGTGHAIGIAIDYDSSDNDLKTFAAYFGIVRTGHNFHVPVDGGQPYNPNGSVESTLDTETVATLDPGADMYVYNFGAAFTFTEISDAYNKAVSDNKVEVVSSSFGLCEDDSPTSFNSLVTNITKQGAAKGISFVASTGDFGRGGKCSDGTGQDVPAVLKFFTSVGGADPNINSTGKLVSEVEDSGSGGGPSDIFKIPAYQVGLAGVFSTTKRNIPDVSGPYFPDAFFLAGQWGTIGGTSWAAPATAAFLVEANQVEGARTGFANPAIYAAFKSQGYKDFNDLISGNNGIACKAGYDDCSGIGTLKAFPLANTM
ncbi:MAG TPA: S53 family serine peptidase [Candidatus Eremiobacteraceae bacterium]|nr:S53 family serine peptidase [Candidatus Eremiobacteraceae bacterium]